MPVYRIKASEIWHTEYFVIADNEADAIMNFKKGDGAALDDKHEYVEINNGEAGVDCQIGIKDWKRLSDYGYDTCGIVNITLDSE